MTASPVAGLLDVLQAIPDPRERKGLRHSLPAMLAAVVCGILCGVRGYRALVQWLHLQPPPFWHMLGFHLPPPKRRAFSDLLEQIPAEVLADVLNRWVQGVQGLEGKLPEAAPIEGAEIWDGKTMCGTKNRHQRAWQHVVRLDLATNQVLSRTPVNADTNEARTALELLQSLLLTGKVIVADAAYCQREFCQQIVDSGGDYVVTVKDNQPQLHRDVRNAFALSEGFSPLRPEAGRSPAASL